MRLKYIDALRGFTMFLVVFWHVMSLSFGIDNSVVGHFFRIFRMPMFFFISGFIGYKSFMIYDFPTLKKFVKRKSFIQLVPLAIIYSVYKWTFGGSPTDFFSNGLVGYWFTLVLLEMFLILYFLNFICCRLKNSKFHDIFLIFLILTTWVLGLFIAHSPDRFPHFFTVLSIGNLFSYLPYFCMGTLVRKYEEKSLKIITNKYFFTFSFAGFIAGFLLTNLLFTRDNNIIIYYLFNAYILRFFGMFFVFDIFYYSANFFEKDSFVSKMMQFVGSRTLDIYLLHYFFLPDLHIYKNFFILGREFVIGELVIMGTIAASIIALCLLISSCLRKSDILAKYLFGILPKR